MVRPLIAILQKSDDHLLAVGAAVLFLTCAAAELFPQRTTSTVVGAQPSWSHALATRCALSLLLLVCRPPPPPVPRQPPRIPPPKGRHTYLLCFTVSVLFFHERGAHAPPHLPRQHALLQPPLEVSLQHNRNLVVLHNADPSLHHRVVCDQGTCQNVEACKTVEVRVENVSVVNWFDHKSRSPQQKNSPKF